MLQKTVNICGKDVNFRSSASVPRLYRAKFGRDIFKDLSKLEKAYKEKGGEEGSAMEIEDLWSSLICFPSMRCCRRSLSSGAPTSSRMWRLKKTEEKQPGNNDGAVSPSVSGGRAFPFGCRPSHHRDGAGYLDGEGE